MPHPKLRALATAPCRSPDLVAIRVAAREWNHHDLREAGYDASTDVWSATLDELGR